MKSYIYSLSALCLGAMLCFGTVSCDNSDDTAKTSPIALDQSTEVTEIVLTNQSTRTVKLSGGNGKYTASVENARVATVLINDATLEIKALEEGTTKAIVKSQDQSYTFTIRVQAPTLNFSTSELVLLPGTETQAVTLQGGGKTAKIDVKNPEEAITEPVWDAASGVLSFTAKHEGVAIITATAEGQEPKQLTIRVEQSERTNRFGVYTTTHSTPYEVIKTNLTAKRHGKGTWFYNSAKPTKTTGYIFVPKVEAPEVGQTITLQLQSQGLSNFTSGEQILVVEEATEKQLRLRGKGFRLILPR